MRRTALAKMGPNPDPPPLRVVGKKKRIVADVPEALHRAVRIHCAKRGIQIRDYIAELVRRDGIG